MRLIDADAFRVNYDLKCARDCGICSFYDSECMCRLIDEAPTIGAVSAHSAERQELCNADRIRAEIKEDRNLAYLTVRCEQAFDKATESFETVYVCSDGCVAGDWQSAFQHELSWLKSGVSE